MGVNGGGMFLSKSLALSWDHVCYLLFEISKSKNDKSYPCIDIDAHNTAFKTISSPLHDIKKLMKAAVDKGIKVCIVAGGKDCHSSKRSTVKRAAQREVMRLIGIELELKLSALLQKDPSHPGVEVLAKAINKSNKLTGNVLLDDFTVQLSVTINAINNESI